MRYLGLALIREGTTDNRFLAELIRRLVDDICMRKAFERVEIGDVLEILALSNETERRPYFHRIGEAAFKARGSFDILFIHSDGGGDPERARSEHVDPVLAEIGRQMDAVKFQPVAVIPVREMEAWAIADGQALRSAFQTTLSDEELGITEPVHLVERISDPKQKLEEYFQRALGGRKTRRRRAKAAAYLERIGEHVSFEKLRRLEAFQQFEWELHQALAKMCIIAD